MLAWPTSTIWSSNSIDEIFVIIITTCIRINPFRVISHIHHDIKDIEWIHSSHAFLVGTGSDILVAYLSVIFPPILIKTQRK